MAFVELETLLPANRADRVPPVSRHRATSFRVVNRTEGALVVANNPVNSIDNLGLAGAGVNVGAAAQVVVVGGAASAGIGAFSDGSSGNIGVYGAAAASIPGETGMSGGVGVATPGVGIFFSPTANRAEDLNNLTNTAYIFGGWGPGGSLSVSWGGGQMLFERRGVRHGLLTF